MKYESDYLRVLTKLWLKMYSAKRQDRLDANRTKVKTVSLFGQTLNSKVSWDSFPILTTKHIHLHSIIMELIWFLKGDSNIRFLVQNNVSIWNLNAYDHNKKKRGFPNITIKEYIQKIRNDSEFAREYGDLDGGYGSTWRNFYGLDQIERALENLKTIPETRQNVVLGWNPKEVYKIALAPCHFAFQTHVKSGKISFSVYQRSADWFLGVPFNLTSYSLLMLIFAKYTGYEPGSIYMHFGDTHLYENHFDQALRQILRWPLMKKSPQISISDSIIGTDLKNIQESDIVVTGYKHLEKIKADMAV
ncbi:thymidylate synthase [Patescibacteria group bacterium]|nr:thymidylate synthase [Patescibacteria group bacterium]